jgi:hypothetical protein
LRVRPANRFKDETVFFRFEISCVFAGSPRYRLLGPKPTKDLAKELAIAWRVRQAMG